MTDSERRLRAYVRQLVVERETLRQVIRDLQRETARLAAQQMRQAVKDSLRGMEN
jgi:hypothetical protein